MSRATQDTTTLRDATDTQLSCSTVRLSRRFSSHHLLRRRGPTTPPGPEPRRFGLFPGRSPLLGESLLFSLPAGTKMFQFPALASAHADGSPSDCRVVPFGNRGIKGHLHLPRAYRSLSRPSSPARAKASTIRPYLLSFALFPAGWLTSHVAGAGMLVYFQLSLVKSFSLASREGALTCITARASLDLQV